MDRIVDVAAKFDALRATYDAYIATLKADVAAQIKAAIEADDAAENEALMVLAQKIDEAVAAVPLPEVPPFEPSGNAG